MLRYTVERTLAISKDLAGAGPQPSIAMTRHDRELRIIIASGGHLGGQILCFVFPLLVPQAATGHCAGLSTTSLIGSQ
jgi:hypothetical protein